VRLAQTLIDRNVRVCGAMTANRGIPHDLDGEGKRWKKEKSAFKRNGDVMVQVWNNKTCVNDKYDPRHNWKKREERQENKHGNNEALCRSPEQ